MNDNILPELNFAFVSEMKEYKVPFFPDKQKSDTICGSWHLQPEFPDADNLLDTAYDSCRRYLGAGKFQETADSGFCVKTVKKNTSVFEEYSLEITPGTCTIAANDTEGIRRGIYEFIDLFCANDGNFPATTQSITRKPFISIRLGRCPFSPIKRWPVNTDELLDEIDYYPEAYLETLAHDGINGIWMVSQLRELGTSSFTVEDPDRRKRLAKLAKVAKKCSRFGVKVWLFMIEPFALPDDDELCRNHPELFMAKEKPFGRNLFCPASEATGKYLREITKSIFSEIPALGGVIDIVYGERPSTCPSARLSFDNTPLACQNDCGLSINEIMQKALQAISDGIKAGSADAKLIAWYYMPLSSPLAAWCQDFAKYTPDDVIAQFNFESAGEKVQLGKTHIAGDYWVSYEGPSPRFTAAARQRTGKLMGAKLQLGCGHELTPVPYIPVPEIAYNKYKALKSLGVSSVMQSWYIGNFPGIMELACGRLAFHDFNGTAAEFMLDLARPIWGRYAESVVEAWQIFAEAYRQFPFALMFQYYAPQNSFMMWKHNFLPELAPLAPPWKPNFEFGGDAIGEALAGFTLEDAITLMDDMSSQWHNGMAKLMPLKEIFKDSDEHIRDIGVAELLENLICGTALILKFFLLRRELYTEKLPQSGYIAIIEKMKELIEQHKILCQKSIPLLEADSRLGYHGEALCRIFDEFKTAKALDIADRSLADAEKLIEAVKNGSTPLQYAEKLILDKLPPNEVRQTKNCSWFWHKQDDKFVLTITGFPADTDIWGKVFFMDLTGTRFALQDSFDVKDGKCLPRGNMHQIITGKAFDSKFTMDYQGTKLVMTWPIESLPGAKEEKMIRFTFRFGVEEEESFAKGNGGILRLYLGTIKPDETFTIEL